MSFTNKEHLKNILRESKTIAVVGCSSNPEKYAYKIPKYLQEHGYRIIPVNPFAKEILGEKTYKTVSEIKDPVDIVNVFRPSEETLQVVKQAIKIKPKVVWMQLGIKNEEAAKLAETNGMRVVMDTCIMVKHKQLIER